MGLGHDKVNDQQVGVIKCFCSQSVSVYQCHFSKIAVIRGSEQLFKCRKFAYLLAYY